MVIVLMTKTKCRQDHREPNGMEDSATLRRNHEDALQRAQRSEGDPPLKAKLYRQAGNYAHAIGRKLEDEARLSLTRQKDLESRDQPAFNQYLEQFYAQYR